MRAGERRSSASVSEGWTVDRLSILQTTVNAEPVPGAQVASPGISRPPATDKPNGGDNKPAPAKQASMKKRGDSKKALARGESKKGPKDAGTGKEEEGGKAQDKAEAAPSAPPAPSQHEGSSSKGLLATLDAPVQPHAHTLEPIKPRGEEANKLEMRGNEHALARQGSSKPAGDAGKGEQQS
jgi:hypothetical protein